MESSSKTSRLPYLGKAVTVEVVLESSQPHFNLDFASYPLTSNQDFRQSG